MKRAASEERRVKNGAIRRSGRKQQKNSGRCIGAPLAAPAEDRVHGPVRQVGTAPKSPDDIAQTPGAVTALIGAAWPLR